MDNAYIVNKDRKKNRRRENPLLHAWQASEPLDQIT